MDDNWVPVIGMLCVFGFPLGALIVSRVLAHRERMEMIRHGIYPPIGKGSVPRYASGVQPGPGGPMSASEQQPEASRLLRKGIGLSFIGMALTIGLSFIGYHPGEHGDERFVFGPWLLGGLIPLFIGLSQVAIAFVTDPQIFARFGGSGRSRSNPAGPYYGPPPGPGPGPGPGPMQPPGGFDNSYTYRPGGTQELRPPTPPPTRRK